MTKKEYNEGHKWGVVETKVDNLASDIAEIKKALLDNGLIQMSASNKASLKFIYGAITFILGIIGLNQIF